MTEERFRANFSLGTPGSSTAFGKLLASLHVSSIPRLTAEQCVLCNEFLWSNDCYKSTQCIHYYHRKCALRHLQFSNRCDVCRKVLTPITQQLSDLTIGEVPDDINT
jgi:hypothetical protein